MNTGRNAPRDRGCKSPITAARMSAGLTQAQLAEQLGCAQAHVSRWERGSAVPETSTLLKLSRILSCPMEQLITAGEG